jgi:hypothetical protein
MIFLPSSLILFAFLTNLYIVFGSTDSGTGKGVPLSTITLAELDIKTNEFSYVFEIKTNEFSHVNYSLTALLENELSARNCDAIFIGELSIDGSIIGPRYFTSKPEKKIVILEGVKYFHIYSLKIYSSKDPATFRLNEEYMERTKRELVTRSIFVGRNENILVSNVIIGKVNYGPILLPAKFE